MRVRIPTARATVIRFIRTSIRSVAPALCRHLGPRWARAVTSERQRDDVSVTSARALGGVGWRRECSRHSDLNRGPAVYETAALPLSYVGAPPRIADAPNVGQHRAIRHWRSVGRSGTINRGVPEPSETGGGSHARPGGLRIDVWKHEGGRD